MTLWFCIEMREQSSSDYIDVVHMSSSTEVASYKEG